MILEGGLKYKDTLGTSKDIEYISGLKLNREEICAAFGVPTMMVGILDRATYSNYLQASKIFLSNTIIPKLKRVQAVVQSIIRMYDINLFFEFDTSGQEALKEDEQRNATIAKIYFDMGYPANEINKRFKLGFSEIEGGDTGYLPMGLTPIDRILEPPAPPPMIAPPLEDEDEKRKNFALKYYTKTRKLMLSKQFDEHANIIERQYRRIIDRFFMGLEISSIRALRIAATDRTAKVESILYDLDETIKAWNKRSEKVHLIALASNGQMQIDNLGASRKFDTRDPFVENYLKTFSPRKAREVITANRNDLLDAIVKGFKDISAEKAVEEYSEINAAIQEGVLQGEGIKKISKRIQEVFEPYRMESWRATRIAQTEVIAASNKGALEAYRQLDPMSGKFWNPAYINTRDTHLEAGSVYNEMNPIPLDEPFQVGAGSGMHPGEIGIASEDINCHCAVLPVVDPEAF
jgi:hypothetical protein